MDKDKIGMIGGYFEELESMDADPVQKLKILEVVLRIIYADKRVHENEVKFFLLIRARLRVPDGIFFKRFGLVDFLSDGSYAPDKDPTSVSSLADSIAIPSLQQAARPLLDKELPGD